MNVGFGKIVTAEGPGVEINLTGNELAIAITAYLVAHGIHIDGPRTIYVEGKLCGNTRVHVDPSGNVMWGGTRYTGSGEIQR